MIHWKKILQEKMQVNRDIKFNSFSKKWNRINGWLATAEAEWLFNTAKSLNMTGDVVEIGSFEGKSTVCLGIGTKMSKLGKVFSIDPHTGGIAYVKTHPEAPMNLNSLDPFLKNINHFNLTNTVVPLIMTSREAFSIWKRGCLKMVFVDGWHSFEEAYFDISHWGSLLQDGGVLAIHDYTWEEVRKAIDKAALDLKLKAPHQHVTANLVYFIK